jgi:ABC-type Fe3+ transport system permease subunit
MRDLWQGMIAALRLLLSGDAALWQIIALSLWVSGAALIISAIIGVPLGAWLGLRSFPGRRLVTAWGCRRLLLAYSCTSSYRARGRLARWAGSSRRAR